MLVHKINFKHAALVAALSITAFTPAIAETEQVTVKWQQLLPAFWDPVRSTCGCDIEKTSLVYDSLTRPDNTGKAVPSLATGWKYNADGTEVTFTLRQGVKFSDGTPLDAAAVAKHFERTKNASYSTLASQLATVKSVTADGADKVVFHLNRTDYSIPSLISARVGLIESPTADPESLSTKPVGSGPYILTQNVAGSRVVLKKNPDYWDANSYKITDFVISAPGNNATVVTSLASGAIDVAEIGADQIDAAKAAGLEVQVIPTQNQQFYNVNVRNGVLKDPKVLEAVRIGIDRQAYVDSVLGGGGEPNVQPFPKGYVGYDPGLEKQWPYDPEKAKALLAEAGYNPGDLSIVISSKATIPGAAEFLQGSLKTIGISSTIKTVVNWQQETYLRQNHEIIGDGHVGRESPILLLDALYGKNGLLNGSRAATPEFEAALDAVRSTPEDAPSYPEVLQKATRIGTLSGSDIIVVSKPRIIARNADLTPLPASLFTYRWEQVGRK